MSDRRLKIKETDVVLDGVVYRPIKDGYGVCNYTEDLPEKVVVLDRIGAAPVTALLKNCFSGSALCAVSLPDSLREIDGGAFRSCTNLLEVKVPDEVRVIGFAVFKKCKSLRRLELGRHTKQVGWSLCEACKSIEEFVVWNEVECLGANLFWQGGKKLQYTEYSHGLYLGNPENPYVILDGNTRIEKGEQPVVVELHPETRFITSCAFNRLREGAVSFADIDQLIIHDNVLNIEGGAFTMDYLGYSSIKTVCADSIEMLCRAGGGMLQNSRCLIVGGKEISELLIPKNVTTIADYTFLGCNWLKSVTFEGNIDEIAYSAFQDCENLKSITFPARVGCIGSRAFKGCTALERLELFRVEKIDREAFAADGASLLPYLQEEMRMKSLRNFTRKGLKEIVFHDTVDSLGPDAFVANMRLETVTGMENVKIMEHEDRAVDPFSYTPFASRFIK